MSTPAETSPELDWSPCRHADSGSAVCRYCAPQRYERLVESLRGAHATLQAENAELRERLEAAEGAKDRAIEMAAVTHGHNVNLKTKLTAAEGERDDYKFQLESVISERPHWDELDRKLTNLAGGLEGTALAIAEARRREAEGERDEWEGRWLERGDDLKLAEGERDRLREALERARVEFKRIAELARVSGWPVMAAIAEKAATRAIPHTEGKAK